MILKLCTFKRGHNLIELIVALGITAVLISGIASVFSDGIRWMRKCEDMTMVHIFLQEKLEEKLTKTPWPPTAEARAPITGFSRYERGVEIIDIGEPNLREIRVTVWWPGGSQEYATLVSNF